MRTSVSIIVFPTKNTRSRPMPSARRFSSASGLCVKHHRASWSTSTRLISSGIVRSKLRRPDSMCATGIPSFAAARAPARVELTSPGTISAAGRRCSSTPSIRSIARAV